MAAMLSAVRIDCGRPLPAVRSMYQLLNTWQFSKKIIKHASFPILVGKFFYQSSGRKSFTFPQIFNQKFIFKTQHNCSIVTNNSSKVL